MSTECTVCYATDLNYLLPAIVSASTLRRFISSDKADIFIFLVDEKDNKVQEINQLLSSYAITIVSMESKSYVNFDHSRFRNTGLPLSALARFHIDALLPSKCQRIVYLDCDTWIYNSPLSLIDANIPEGRFAAVEDMISFRAFGPSSGAEATRKYFRGLNLKPKNGYFNSGVFAVGRKTWSKVSDEAFKYFLENGQACLFHDQSALNAVVGDRRLHISLKWNFQTPFKNLGLDRHLEPVICHFTKYPKPWMCICNPWEDIYPQFQKNVLPFLSLNLPVKLIGEPESLRYKKTKKLDMLFQMFPPLQSITHNLLGFNAYEKCTWL